MSSLFVTLQILAGDVRDRLRATAAPPRSSTACWSA